MNLTPLPIVPLMLALLTQDQATFRTGTALVRLDAEVRTETASVSDLQKEDFLVFDNRTIQPVVYFGHGDQPLDVILLFDASHSMRPVVARVAEAAHTALSALRKGDRAAVMAFHSRTDLITDFTDDTATVEKSIAEQVLQRNFACCTHIQAALADAARHFAKQPESTRRRAIVIVTDDDGTRGQADALHELWNADAVVLGVIVNTGLTGPSRFGHFEYFGMRDIAAGTGGDSLDTGDAAEGLRKMFERLRDRYTLYYALPNVRPGEVRSVQIQLTRAAQSRHPRAFVRARTGYVAPL